jgi:hypothetical protein
MHGKMRLSFAFGLLVILMTLVAPLTQPASAAGCSGIGCNRKDPGTTGCSIGSSVLQSTSFIYRSGKSTPFNGVIELKYSPTCKTKWAKVTLTKSAQIQLGLKDKAGNMIRDSWYMTANQSAYGQMWYAPTQSVKACVYVGYDNQQFCTALG